jgi:response regulator RpfG family c-di-GMP phosphodiesterase
VSTNSDKRIILLVDDTPANIQMANNILKEVLVQIGSGEDVGRGRCVDPDI